MLTNRFNYRYGTVSHRLLKEATMQKWINALLIAFLLATTLLTPGVVHAQDDPMSHCEEGAFSTEEGAFLRGQIRMEAEVDLGLLASEEKESEGEKTPEEEV